MVKTVESSQPEENYPKPYAPLTVQPPTTLPQDKKTYYFAPMKVTPICMRYNFFTYCSLTPG